MEMSGVVLPPLAPPGVDPSRLAGGSSPRDPRAIEAVAKGFESMFLSILIKEMRQTLEPDTMFGQDRSDVLGGLFDYYLGEQMAPAGTLGIAAMVKKQLTPRRAR